MDTPFLVEARSPDVAQARLLVEALGRRLDERGFRVRIDGVETGAGRIRVDLRAETGARCELRVAVRLNEPSWLPPLPLPDGAAQAEAAAVAFLERWGFTERAAAASAP